MTLAWIAAELTLFAFAGRLGGSMVALKPHYLLFCGVAAGKSHSVDSSQPIGKWHFVLESLESEARLEATDTEVGVTPDRIALIALVRGLEALEQPSRVTLVSGSRYLTRGLRFGLSEWRDNAYRWEHFGVQRPIRNADLWKRVDQALAFHDVTCRLTPELGWLADLPPEEIAEFIEIDSAVTPPTVEPAVEPISPRAKQAPKRAPSRQQGWKNAIRDLSDWVAPNRGSGWQLAGGVAG